MKEYTIIALFSVGLTILVDKLTRVNLLGKKLFYLFLAIIFCFKLLVNGCLTKTNIVIYNPKFF